MHALIIYFLLLLSIAGHFCLPTGLAWPMTPAVATALDELLRRGKEVFLVRIRVNQFNLVSMYSRFKWQLTNDTSYC